MKRLLTPILLFYLIFFISCRSFTENEQMKFKNSSPGTEAEHLVELGNYAHMNGKYNTALNYFNDALNLDPEFDLAYNNRGLVYFNLKEYDKAIDDFNKTIEINDEIFRVYYNRGICYFYKNDFKNAISDYTKEIKIDPGFAAAYNNRAVCYWKLKSYDKTLENLQKSIQLDPDDSFTLYNLACYYSQQNNKLQSLTYLEKSIEKGYNNYLYMENDADLNNIRDDEKYKSLILKLKENAVFEYTSD